MPERQVSLQELESKLDSFIHDVENGATVVVSRDGRQVARIIPEPQASLAEEELTEEAIRALEEGCADHAAGRTFTMAEVKRELRIEP